MRFQTCATAIPYLLAAALFASCSDSTTPNPGASPTMDVADLVGTYTMVQKDGRALPAVDLAAAANGKADTLYAGCLILGPITNPQIAAKDQQGYVNVTPIYNKSAADAYASNPGVCPRFMQAASQAYHWSGSSGKWWFCGAHSCSFTAFTAATVNGRIVVSTGSSGTETRYVKQ